MSPVAVLMQAAMRPPPVGLPGEPYAEGLRVGRQVVYALGVAEPLALLPAEAVVHVCGLGRGPEQAPEAACHTLPPREHRAGIVRQVAGALLLMGAVQRLGLLIVLKACRWQGESAACT